MKEGQDFKVIYPAGRVKSGTYTVVVEGIYRYTGSAELKFTISGNNPATTSIKKLSRGKKCFAVKWKKPAKKYKKTVTGYQVQYSLNGNFSKPSIITVKSYNRTSLKVKKLAKKKKYYVRVRTYRKSGNSYYYSYWSPTQTVQTK